MYLSSEIKLVGSFNDKLNSSELLELLHVYEQFPWGYCVRRYWDGEH